MQANTLQIYDIVSLRSDYRHNSLTGISVPLEDLTGKRFYITPTAANPNYWRMNFLPQYHPLNNTPAGMTRPGNQHWRRLDFVAHAPEMTPPIIIHDSGHYQVAIGQTFPYSGSRVMLMHRNNLIIRDCGSEGDHIIWEDAKRAADILEDTSMTPAQIKFAYTALTGKKE